MSSSPSPVSSRTPPDSPHLHPIHPTLTPVSPPPSPPPYDSDTDESHKTAAESRSFRNVFGNALATGLSKLLGPSLYGKVVSSVSSACFPIDQTRMDENRKTLLSLEHGAELNLVIKMATPLIAQYNNQPDFAPKLEEIILIAITNLLAAQQKEFSETPTLRSLARYTENLILKAHSPDFITQTLHGIQEQEQKIATPQNVTSPSKNDRERNRLIKLLFQPILDKAFPNKKNDLGAAWVASVTGPAQNLWDKLNDSLPVILYDLLVNPDVNSIKPGNLLRFPFQNGLLTTIQDCCTEVEQQFTQFEEQDRKSEGDRKFAESHPKELHERFLPIASALLMRIGINPSHKNKIWRYTDKPVDYLAARLSEFYQWFLKAQDEHQGALYKLRAVLYDINVGLRDIPQNERYEDFRNLLSPIRADSTLEFDPKLLSEPQRNTLDSLWNISGATKISTQIDNIFKSIVTPHIIQILHDYSAVIAALISKKLAIESPDVEKTLNELLAQLTDKQNPPVSILWKYAPLLVSIMGTKMLVNALAQVRPPNNGQLAVLQDPPQHRLDTAVANLLSHVISRFEVHTASLFKHTEQDEKHKAAGDEPSEERWKEIFLPLMQEMLAMVEGTASPKSQRMHPLYNLIPPSLLEVYNSRTPHALAAACAKLYAGIYIAPTELNHNDVITRHNLHIDTLAHLVAAMSSKVIPTLLENPFDRSPDLDHNLATIILKKFREILNQVAATPEKTSLLNYLDELSQGIARNEKVAGWLTRNIRVLGKNLDPASSQALTLLSRGIIVPLIEKILINLANTLKRSDSPHLRLGIVKGMLTLGARHINTLKEATKLHIHDKQNLVNFFREEGVLHRALDVNIANQAEVDQRKMQYCKDITEKLLILAGADQEIPPVTLALLKEQIGPLVMWLIHSSILSRPVFNQIKIFFTDILNQQLRANIPLPNDHDDNEDDVAEVVNNPNSLESEYNALFQAFSDWIPSFQIKRLRALLAKVTGDASQRFITTSDCKALLAMLFEISISSLHWGEWNNNNNREYQPQQFTGRVKGKDILVALNPGEFDFFIPQTKEMADKYEAWQRERDVKHEKTAWNKITGVVTNAIEISVVQTRLSVWFKKIDKKVTKAVDTLFGTHANNIVAKITKEFLRFFLGITAKFCSLILYTLYRLVWLCQQPFIHRQLATVDNYLGDDINENLIIQLVEYTLDQLITAKQTVALSPSERRPSTPEHKVSVH